MRVSAFSLLALCAAIATAAPVATPAENGEAYSPLTLHIADADSTNGELYANNILRIAGREEKNKRSENGEELNSELYKESVLKAVDVDGELESEVYTGSVLKVAA